ncbi:hypothetical protein DPMN_093166 [Dreissena polymorpha]|uniref:Uncharacterized protein n=1 Tax=Dreissena polymorpha TaxID=45954 RepID=A0A9D4R0M9_DREPO|nr:hypothetical protein DPMN_093166 [Dreissena polymorpha]
MNVTEVEVAVVNRNRQLYALEVGVTEAVRQVEHLPPFPGFRIVEIYFRHLAILLETLSAEEIYFLSCEMQKLNSFNVF